MTRRLTTVAAYDLAAKAHLAKNALEAAGIPAVVTDQEIVAMDWLLANSVGGIKVQVWEADGERAAAVLDETFGPHAGLASEDLDEDELARQALAEPGGEAEPGDPPAAASGESPAAPAPVDREGYAWRAFVIAWWGVGIWPLSFYALYLFLNAALGPGELSALGRFRLVVSGLTLLGSLVVCALVLGA